jgi:hypothetical protein
MAAGWLVPEGRVGRPSNRFGNGYGDEKHRMAGQYTTRPECKRVSVSVQTPRLAHQIGNFR